MSWIRRYSSRRTTLDMGFLQEQLRCARSYWRIAGYFRSSILSLTGEALDRIPDVRIVCNSDLDPADLRVARYTQAALLERWNEPSPEVESLLRRDQYARLHQLLTQGNVQIRVVPRQTVFLHGKAGVIEREDGSYTSFLGSANETLSAFTSQYELIWEDNSPEAVAWVKDEFNALWNIGVPLPEAIIDEIGRLAKRTQITWEGLNAHEAPGAVFAESPIYRTGEQLQPWQRSFVTLCLKHRERYEKVRLLLADEVGLGKTLSLAAAASLFCLLDDGPVLILCPATLTLQWQVELLDRLGIPSAIWSSRDKIWLDPQWRAIRTRGAEDITRCPMQIAIVSTGLAMQQSPEAEALQTRRYGTVVLDEAHRARKQPRQGPNNLFTFMRQIAGQTRHLLLGTATPVQTSVSQLWDLLEVLGIKAPHVLGREYHSLWRDCDRAFPIVAGKEIPESPEDLWPWLQDPFPPSDERNEFTRMRRHLDMPEQESVCIRSWSDLPPFVKNLVKSLPDDVLRSSNPILRHTVLRRREMLEDRGLLDRVAVTVHPDRETSYGDSGLYQGGLITNYPFERAYEAAERYCEALGRRNRGAGFMKSLLLQRICSSFAAGRNTALHLLNRSELDDTETDDNEATVDHYTLYADMTSDEEQFLKVVIDQLSRPEAKDPKARALKYFLLQHRVEGLTWLEHGCIVFSQYYDTVRYLGDQLAQELPDEPIGVYAGAGKSGLYRHGEFSSVERNDIKEAVRTHQLRLLLATDAACEGLNLQMLGTLINVDLPWNPSRLEQRLGRIKRFGQTRSSVDMLNLVYQGTQDQRIYQVLSQRMRDRYDLFGGLPDVIEDAWIEDIERLEEELDKYIHLRDQNRNAFEIRYSETIDPDANRWELCSRVLSRRDIEQKMSNPW